MLNLYKKTKPIIGILLCFMNMFSMAAPVPNFSLKREGKVTLSQQKIIMQALQYINAIWANDHALSRKTTLTYFTPDTILVINGRTVYTGYNQLEEHFQAVGKNIHGNFQFPFLVVIGARNTVVAHFNEDIVDINKVHYPTNVIAIFTFRRGRIERWEEVVNTPYFCQASSAKVVFSR